MKPRDLIEQILSMQAFGSVLQELKTADSVNGGNIETALHACLKEVHDQLRSEDVTPEVMRHLLYREGMELKAHAGAYLSYEGELAKRQAALWRFALETTGSFFRLVFDDLDDYFRAKTEVIVAEVEKDAEWYTGLRDTAKKSGELLNVGAKLLKKGSQYIKEQASVGREGFGTTLAQTAAELINRIPESGIDTRDVVQKAIGKHLAPEVLGHDLKVILERAAQGYEQAWVAEIKSQTPDLTGMRAFSPSGATAAELGPIFDLGIAEHTLAVGLGGAVLGTLSLAAGWHTLAYAIVHVFYPAAILVAAAAAGIALYRKDQDLEKRRERVREAVIQYHRYFLLELDTGKRPELGGLTLRDALTNQAKELVEQTLRTWERAISGNLTTDHYRRLSGAVVSHLILVQQCVQVLDGDGRNETTGPA